MTLPVFGAVSLSGTLTPNNTFRTTLPDRSMLGGLVAQRRHHSGGDRATVAADLAVPNLGVTTKLGGWIKADGTYSLTATAGFNLAGFRVSGGTLTLGDKLNVNFTLPIPSFGNVTFRGSYGATGWAIEGRVPVNVQIGIVTLKQIILGIGKDQGSDVMKLGAKGTIASINGIVDATATAKLYSDGRINLQVTADAVKLGSYTASSIQVGVANDTPAGRGVYVASFTGSVAIPVCRVRSS